MLQPVNPDLSIPLQLRGRLVFDLALAALQFWLRHKDTLEPVVDPRFAIVMNDLADLVNVIKGMKWPGPQ